MSWAPIAVDGYDQLEPVGAGGFSQVYKARDLDFNRTVALKVLNVGFGDDKAERRFKSECEAIGSLDQHPGVVSVHRVGQTKGGQPFIAMQYFDGGSVADRLEAGPIEVGLALEIAEKVAGALATAHRADILHRDVKPENILLNEFGPALADFGIALAVSDGDAAGNTTKGMLTPLHAAPELFDGQDATIASDIYSFGSTLHTIFEGTSPFGRENLLATIRAKLAEPLPPIRRSDVDGRMKTLIGQMLERDPLDRPGSMQQVVEEIVELRKGNERHSPNQEVPPPRPRRVASSAESDLATHHVEPIIHVEPRSEDAAGGKPADQSPHQEESSGDSNRPATPQISALPKAILSIAGLAVMVLFALAAYSVIRQGNGLPGGQVDGADGRFENDQNETPFDAEPLVAPTNIEIVENDVGTELAWTHPGGEDIRFVVTRTEDGVVAREERVDDSPFLIGQADADATCFHVQTERASTRAPVSLIDEVCLAN